MKIKTSKGVKEVNEVFTDLESFKNHVLKLDENIRYDNETIKKEMKSLMVKLEEQEGVVSLSLMRGWLVKNYSFKTKKWGNIEYFIERGWNEGDALEEINKRNKELKQRNRLCEEYWINKGYSKEEAIKEISKQQQKSSKCVKTYHGKSKQMLVDKGYSEEEIKRICLTPTNIDFWLNKGYSENEAKDIISKNQTEAAKQVDFEKRLIPSNIEYWINKGFSKEEAKLKVSTHQSTFTLDKCIEKYGEEDGKKRFTERQIKWQETLYRNGKLKSGYSQISQDLFYELIKDIDVNCLNNILFAKKGGEFVLSDVNGFYRYDFTDLKNKRIIEYNGDDYHGNPNKYKADDFPNPFRKNITAQEIWDRDKHKKMLAEQHGFEVLVIWDSEYRWGDKKEIINKCISFLNKK
jgi:hypothetical protein